jgi:hypothetical protein
MRLQPELILHEKITLSGAGEVYTTFMLASKLEEVKKYKNKVVSSDTIFTVDFIISQSSTQQL